MSQNQMNEKLKHLKRILVFLDACFLGSFPLNIDHYIYITYFVQSNVKKNQFWRICKYQLLVQIDETV